MHNTIYNLQRVKEDRNADEKYIAEENQVLEEMNWLGAGADYVRECENEEVKTRKEDLKAYWAAKGLSTKESPNGNLLIERDQIEAYVGRQIERAREPINQLFKEKTNLPGLLYSIEHLLNDKAGLWFISDYRTLKTEYDFLSCLLNFSNKTFEMELLQTFDYHM